ncbi:MAG: SDR family NAD(P)-dependent oxidoreductase [Anaerolineae bacterium]|nr:SDR family NAD(P)-dependent oxidoreductase [Anaerolineae bacterium]
MTDDEMNSLTNKVAIITGAGQGIGTAVAHTLAAAGMRVAVNDLNPDRAERVAVEIAQAGGQAIAVTADVANKFQCVHLIETTRAAWGQLDVLVNNAAVMPQSSVLKMDEWDWNRCLDVNLKGVFLMSQLCGRVMADENGERGGLIVNIASTAGVDVPFANRAAYCASKAGVVGFTRECAREFAQFGVRVCALALPENEPGDVDTAVATQILNLGNSQVGQPAWNPEMPIIHLNPRFNNS